MKNLGLAMLLLLVGCGGAGATMPSVPASLPPMPTPTASASAPTPAMWKPSLSDSFQWILGAPLDTTSNATVYDIDDFGASASDVATLHALGRHVVCYIDVGSYEDYRPDVSMFPPSVIGNPYPGYPDEWWLDIRQIALLTPVMTERFNLCKSKGFDAVEPDNVDGYENNTGFPLTAADQIAYNTWIAGLAHARGLSVLLKNDGDQAAQLEPIFDFALEESCWFQGSCSQLAPFHAAGKAVFTVEYTGETSSATFISTDCPQAKQAGYYALLKDPQLDAWIETCP